jgi:hypothetical protein
LICSLIPKSPIFFPNLKSKIQNLKLTEPVVITTETVRLDTGFHLDELAGFFGKMQGID